MVNSNEKKYYMIVFNAWLIASSLPQSYDHDNMWQKAI